MKVAFAKMSWFNPLDIAIALCSHGSKIHVELLFSNGVCYSSRPFTGTDFKQINLKPKDWVIVELPPLDEQKVIDFCFSEIDCGYDWTGVLAFVFPWMKCSKSRWFCSEFVVSALQHVGLYSKLDAYKTSPNAFFNFLK